MSRPEPRIVPSGTDPSSLWPHLYRIVVAVTGEDEAFRVASVVEPHPARIISPEPRMRCCMCDGIKSSAWPLCQDCHHRLERAGLRVQASEREAFIKQHEDEARDFEGGRP